jgi:uncharacterized membrane protein (GlpM family)
MTQYILKVAISAAVIVAVAEISKRSTFIGALLASLPRVSLLGMIFLYVDTKDTEKVAQLSLSIFWLVLPSLALLVVLPFLLRAKMNFYGSLGAAFAAMLACYAVMLVVLNKWGIKL